MIEMTFSEGLSEEDKQKRIKEIEEETGDKVIVVNGKESEE